MLGQSNPVKDKLAEGRTVIGTFIKSVDPAITELVCQAGMDFVILDNEHTAMSKETLVNLIRVTEIHGVPAIVRVRDDDTSQILQALDTGAYGVQVPNLRTAEDARKAVDAMYYAPKGKRGFANTQRAAGYGGMPVGEYLRRTSENLLFVGYCETREAYANLDSILDVDGLDIVFMGPSDLSQAFGVIGQVDHPLVRDAMDDIIVRTVRAGRVAGTVAADGAAARRLAERGVRFIVMSSDHGMVTASAKRMLADFRA
ncbi:MAG: 2-dehydro-3-deoxyglucarate aldolase [Clostridia bacterium]|nr:2-dehydro-3-deoxyglucarate aldolase [Clostridia bacterium]